MRRRGYWNRPQSLAGIPITDIQDPLPAGVAQFGLQTASFEAHIAETKWRSGFLLGSHHLAKPLLDERAQGRALARGDLAGVAQQRIGYFERRFHGSNNYGLLDMGSNIEDKGEQYKAADRVIKSGNPVGGTRVLRHRGASFSMKCPMVERSRSGAHEIAVQPDAPARRF